jgi:hypothetical protein
MITAKENTTARRIDLSPLLNNRKSDNENRLVKSIIEQINEYIEKVIPGLSVVATCLREKDLAAANQNFTGIIEGMDWIAQLIAIFKERYGQRFTELRAQNLDAAELERDLLDVLTNVVSAHIRGEWTSAADTIEKELATNLKSWRLIFPQVVNLEENNTL